jgi:hypothetical protein
MGQKRIACRVLVGNFEGTDQLEDLGLGRRMITKLILKV